MGLCRICSQSHELPICGAVLQDKNLKIIVSNIICDSCIEKVDYIFKNNLIFNEESKLPIHNGERKIILVDAATNTDNIHNYEYQIRQVNAKKISESTALNEQGNQSKSCIKKDSQESDIQDDCEQIPRQPQPAMIQGTLEDVKQNKKIINCNRKLFCEFCKKKFTHTGDLNKHRRKHTGERPYDCSLCNRKFSHASNLVRHQRLHSGEKPFSCPLKCGKNFSRKDKLSNHLSKHHPNT